MNQQQALALRLNPEPGFSNFVAEGNEEILDTLQNIAGADSGRFIYLWGAAGTGKSHLLQAVCNAAAALRQPAAYLPLAQLTEYTADCLAGFGNISLICLDDMDRILQRPDWQEALYQLYNAVRQSNGVLISASRAPPRDLPLSLPDLKSRLAWGPAYHLQPLTDEAKCIVLQHLARERGMSLPAESAQYLLKRHSREMHQLAALLERLDRTSLAQQRKLTIPFIREQLLASENQ